MTTGKALLAVRGLRLLLRGSGAQLLCIAAAFLTQTVTLEDQTTVKFEIWCV